MTSVIKVSKHSQVHVLRHSVVSDSLRTQELSLARLLCPRDSPGKNTEVRCPFFLQGLFLTQRLNHLSYVSCIGRWILYHWATWEALLIDWSWSNIVGKQRYHVPYLPFILYDVSVERCAVLESIMLVFKLTLIGHVMLKMIKAWV